MHCAMHERLEGRRAILRLEGCMGDHMGILRCEGYGATIWVRLVAREGPMPLPAVSLAALQVD